MKKQTIILKIERMVTLSTNSDELFKVNINLKNCFTKKEFLKNIDFIEIITKIKKTKQNKEILNTFTTILNTKDLKDNNFLKGKTKNNSFRINFKDFIKNEKDELLKLVKDYKLKKRK